mgnify:CR=1 FL=1
MSSPVCSTPSSTRTEPCLTPFPPSTTSPSPHWPQGRPGPLQLEQVLVNLLGNALQAMEDVTEPCLQVRISEQDDVVILQIKDNGAGIQPHNMAHLFEPFFTTKEVGKFLLNSNFNC